MLHDSLILLQSTSLCDVLCLRWHWPVCYTRLKTLSILVKLHFKMLVNNIHYASGSQILACIRITQTWQARGLARTHTAGPSLPPPPGFLTQEVWGPTLGIQQSQVTEERKTVRKTKQKKPNRFIHANRGEDTSLWSAKYQSFLNLSVPRNHAPDLVKMQILFEQTWIGSRHSACLMNSGDVDATGPGTTESEGSTLPKAVFIKVCPDDHLHQNHRVGWLGRRVLFLLQIPAPQTYCIKNSESGVPGICRSNKSFFDSYTD